MHEPMIRIRLLEGQLELRNGLGRADWENKNRGPGFPAAAAAPVNPSFRDNQLKK
jgi:hypothetical protein